MLALHAEGPALWLLVSAYLGYWIGKRKGYPGWGVLLAVMCPIVGLVIIAICIPREPADLPQP
jgi:hypothetical protein